MSQSTSNDTSLWQESLKSLPDKADAIVYQSVLDEFIDESRSAFKILLPDISNARLLYIGNNHDETVFNLAQSCAKLSAFFLSETDTNCQKEKHAGDNLYQNIYLGTLDFNSDHLVDSGQYDGAILDMSLESLRYMNSNTVLESNINYLQTKLIKIIDNSLKPDAWLFLKAGNALDRNRIIHLLKTLKTKILPRQARQRTDASNSDKDKMKTLSGYKQLLAKQGFVTQYVYGFDQPDLATDVLVDLSKHKQIKHFIAHEKFKHLPDWAYRLTAPCFGIFATKQNGQRHIPTLEAIVRTVTEKQKSFNHQVLRTEVNRKNKLIIFLDLNDKPGITIKVPLSALANKHLDHSFTGLTLLSQPDTQTRSSKMNPELITRPLIKDTVNGLPFYAESYIAGTSFGQYASTNNHRLLTDIQTFMMQWTTTTKPLYTPLPTHESLGDKINRIQEILKGLPELEDDFNQIQSLIHIPDDSQNERLFFYKSDFTISNLLVENEHVTGIIDLDFWGYSHNRLVDYADFILSYSRSKPNTGYTDTLLALVMGDYKGLPPELNIQRVMHELRATREELAEAALITWINSISHALEFNRIKLNQARVELMLNKPIKQIAKKTRSLM